MSIGRSSMVISNWPKADQLGMKKTRIKITLPFAISAVTIGNQMSYVIFVARRKSKISLSIFLVGYRVFPGTRPALIQAPRGQ